MFAKYAACLVIGVVISHMPGAFGLTCYVCPEGMETSGCGYSDTESKWCGNVTMSGDWIRCMFMPRPDRDAIIGVFQGAEDLVVNSDANDTLKDPCIEALSSAMFDHLFPILPSNTTYNCASGINDCQEQSYIRLVYNTLANACPADVFPGLSAQIDKLDAIFQQKCCNADGCNGLPKIPYCGGANSLHNSKLAIFSSLLLLVIAFFSN